MVKNILGDAFPGMWYQRGTRVVIPFPTSPGVSSAKWEPSLMSLPWSWRGEILPPPAQRWLVLNEDVKPHALSTASALQSQHGFSGKEQGC